MTLGDLGWKLYDAWQERATGLGQKVASSRLFAAWNGRVLSSVLGYKRLWDRLLGIRSMTDSSARAELAAQALEKVEDLYRDRPKLLRAWVRSVWGEPYFPLPEISPTPHRVIHEQDGRRLLHFPSKSRKGRGRKPLFMVVSLINRYYILDLMSGRSVIEFFTTQGYDVYLYDWGVPKAADRMRRFDDYILKLLPEAAHRARAKAGVPSMHVLGYCIGGTMAACAVALGKIPARTFISLAGPIDFSKAGMLGTWADRRHFNVDRLVDAFGNVPSYLLEGSFKWLDPVGSLTKYVQVARNAGKPDFLRSFVAMETWLNDNVPFPGQAYRKYIGDLYQKNLLMKGQFQLNGSRVNLKDIRCPVLCITGERDDIVPAPSATALLEKSGSREKKRLHLDVGHIGLSTSRRAFTDLWPEVVTWLHRHP